MSLGDKYMTDPKAIVAAAKHHKEELARLAVSLKEIQRTCKHRYTRIDIGAAFKNGEGEYRGVREWREDTYECVDCGKTFRRYLTNNDPDFKE